MPSIFTSVSWPRGRRPRRARLLERLDAVMPWRDLEALVDPFYPKPATGRPPYPLRVMVRVYVLQLVFCLSDESVEDLILDSHSAISFTTLDPWKPRPPGASAIGSFRKLVDRLPEDTVHLAIDLALVAARAELRRGKIIEPVLRIKPGGTLLGTKT